MCDVYMEALCICMHMCIDFCFIKIFRIVFTMWATMHNAVRWHFESFEI
jgi:hypothetical protein